MLALSDSTATTPEDPHILLRQGEAFAGVHDFARALVQYNRALAIMPTFAEAYNDRGHAYYWTGKHVRAIADFTRAIELRPVYPNAYNNRGATYMASGNSARAIADFDSAIKLKPDFRNAYVNRGNAYLRTGHPSLALSDFHHANMYPERTVGMVLGVVLLIVLAGMKLRGRFGTAAVLPPNRED